MAPEIRADGIMDRVQVDALIIHVVMGRLLGPKAKRLRQGLLDRSVYA
jgi:hypothetical protein